MMVAIAHGWDLEVDRGPDWLFVRILQIPRDADDAPPLAESLWRIMQEHFATRLVLEMDQVELLRSFLVGQLVLIAKRLHAGGGLLRICGLSENNRDVLRCLQLQDNFPVYASRDDAVLGHHPRKPR